METFAFSKSGIEDTEGGNCIKYLQTGENKNQIYVRTKLWERRCSGVASCVYAQMSGFQTSRSWSILSRNREASSPAETGAQIQKHTAPPPLRQREVKLKIQDGIMDTNINTAKTHLLLYLLQ